jgi:hypothetical protein
MQRKINQGNIKFSKECSEGYKDLVSKMLQVEPAKRIPLNDIFMHPWVL